MALAVALTSARAHAELPLPLTPHDTTILDAPSGVDRWEPSGAAVIPGERRVWVVNDKAPVLAAYALPLAPGHNAPVAFVRMTQVLDRVKFEAIRYHPRHGLLLLEALRRGVFAGVRFAPDGEPAFDFELKALSAPPGPLDAVPTGPAEFVAVEALAVIGERTITGTRGFKPAAKDEDLRPRTILVDAAGRATPPRTLQYEGRAYGLSDAVCPPGLPDRCYETWTYEREAGETVDDVASLLTVAPIVDGFPGEPRPCARFAAKAEGVTRFGDTLIVVFDNDKARKRPGDPSRFPIEAWQDYATTLPLSACPSP